MKAAQTGSAQTPVGDLTRDLYETAAAVRAVGEQLAKTAKQTLARWQVMYLLSERQLTVPTVARRLGLARQSVQRVVDEMAVEGLLGPHDNPDHQRSPLYALTPEGSAALGQINTAASAWHGEVLRRFSVQELARGRKFLQTLAAVAGAAVKQLPRDGH